MKQLILGIVLGACGAAAVLANQSTVAQSRVAADSRVVDSNGDARTGDGNTLLSSHCTADITGDGMVDVSDLLALLGAWGPCPGCQSDNDCSFNQECFMGDCICLSGFADCDGDPDNGCEVNTQSDASHCGSCNVPCEAGEVCDEGVCTQECTTVFYRDADSDSWGDCNDFIIACAPTGMHTVTICGDCNDDDPTVYPGAPELCNGLDDDCDGVIDNNVVDCPPGTVCVDAACVTP